MQITEIGSDHTVWETLKDGLGYAVSAQARRTFRNDMHLIELAQGAIRHQPQVLEKIRELERDFSKNARRVSTAESQPPPRASDPPPDQAGSERADEDCPTISYAALMSGLIYRRAELQQAILRPIVWEGIRRFTKEYRMVVTHADMYNRKTKRDCMLRVFRTFGVGSADEILFALQRIADMEYDAKNSKGLLAGRGQARIIRVATERLWDHIDAWASDIYAPKRVRAAALGNRIHADEMRIAVEVEGTTHFVPIWLRGGFLHAIKTAINILAEQYRWTPEGAIHFLCGARGMPIVRTATFEFDLRHNLQCLSRITLTVDPTLSAEEVQKIYAYARKQILPHHKPVSNERMMMVREIFTRTAWTVDPDHPDFDERNWGVQLEDWNSELAPRVRGQKRDDTTYPTVGKFKNVALAAWSHLLEPNLTYPDGEMLQAPSHDVYRRAPRGAKRATK